MAADRESNVNVICNWRMPLLGDLNKSNIVVGSRGDGE